MYRKQGLLAIGGAAPESPPEAFRFDPSSRSRWIVAAADSGLYHLHRWNLTPDLIVGDFDSLDKKWLEEHFPAIPRHEYRIDKDETDTEIGLRHLREEGVSDVTLVGGGGGRLDHLMGLLALFDRREFPTRWFTDREVVRAITDSHEFAATVGEIVSFFPAGPDTCRMTSLGFRWQLDGLVWRKGDAGISNECVTERCRVEVSSGRLLMVRNLNLPRAFPWRET
ncbi:MAG: thiamine diphosphokinase [Spirochaetaceae bacterium]|nr:MAG: thiamine diphosphokinase [Spirochaetaceae bacterium]